MTLLQPHLGDSTARTEKLAFLAYSSVQVTVKDGEDFLLEKGTPKDSQGFGPYQNKPFLGPHHKKKRGSYRKGPYGGNSSQSSNQLFSSGEGNRTTEASEVVFDPTQGDEGVETPPANDSLQASLSPPVGGRLRSFRKDWLTNKCLDVLNIITNGYVLPLISKPNLVRAPLIRSGYKALQKDQALASCIQSLLSKNAIERVENVKSLGFYSLLFLVPKPHQRLRPVIDLSRLNTFLLVERFKMETPESIRPSLIPGEWVSSTDLSDAYIDKEVGEGCSWEPCLPTHRKSFPKAIRTLLCTR